MNAKKFVFKSIDLESEKRLTEEQMASHVISFCNYFCTEDASNQHCLRKCFASMIKILEN